MLKGVEPILSSNPMEFLLLLFWTIYRLTFFKKIAYYV